MPANWEEIKDDYKKARDCLWGPKHGNWGRDERNGYYYMWKAYHEAYEAEEKHPLWYGRILAMMASENRYKENPYFILHRYVEPALEQFRLCNDETWQPSQKEVGIIQDMYDDLTYSFSWRESDNYQYEKMVGFIENNQALGDFYFHDSKVISFRHDMNSAELVLSLDGTTVTFGFYGVSSVSVEGVDPEITYLSDFYCYPVRLNSSMLYFDVEFYKIYCRTIKVLSVVQSM